jgi:hypothetical protein
MPSYGELNRDYYYFFPITCVTGKPVYEMDGFDCTLATPRAEARVT